MPGSIRSTATCCLVGCIYFNGFGGRRLEWEHLLQSHVEDQLHKGYDWVLCQHHKTAHTYGELAKWLIRAQSQCPFLDV
eukprot:3119765-Amphidinium_carterae.2